MAFQTTDPDTIRRVLVEHITRIQPTYPRNRGTRWRWVTDTVRGDVTGGLRFFDVIADTELEVPGGAYGEVIEYSLPTRVRVSYPLSTPDMQRHSGADGRDLLALLMGFHAAVPGLVPVAVDSRGQPLLVPILSQDSENAYVVDFTVGPGLRFFASDTVALFPTEG